MAKQEIRLEPKSPISFIGQYQHSDETIFDVIYLHREGLQRAKVGDGLKNRLFTPVTVDELEQEIKDKLITKI
jgi:hypothetical protein